MSLAFDIVLGLALLVLGGLVVAGPRLFLSIVVFAVFGLLMAVVWAHLGAPDLALAEAAIGAGLTGAMLMLCYRRLVALRPERAGTRAVRPTRLALPVALGCFALAFALMLALVSAPKPGDTAGARALVENADGPLGNPVTAVLLQFRGYDTLLEMLVLLVAWLGVAMVGRSARPGPPQPPGQSPLVDALLAAVLPATLLVGGYLLHVGGKAPGGAFQAGAVLAAAGVLLALAGRLEPRPRPGRAQTGLLVLGVAVFAGVGLLPLAQGGPVLRIAGLGAVYLVEGAMMLSIAMTLVLLFLGAAGLGRRR
jgi:multisubunit Na+/H+ antiporter MnhB subunit